MHMLKKIRVGDFKLGDEEKKAINQVLDSGRLSEGEKVKQFEHEWAKFIGTKDCILLSSGTSALIAGLTALKCQLPAAKKRLKIITTPLTYIATSNAIVAAGFEPVYTDVAKDTFVMTPDNIRKHLESEDDPANYVAVLLVHLMGYPCDMDGINKVCKDFNLSCLEDSAQAHGTLYKGKKTGSLSLLSTFSFYIAHNIQAGEMGCINTNNPEIARLVRKIKANGRMCDCHVCTRADGLCPKITSYKGEDDFDPRFTHDLIGYNFKTMEFQAALGITQLHKVDWIIKKRQENVRYLNRGLGKHSDLLQLPLFSEEISYLAYPIVVKNPEVISRKKIRAELEKRGIETRPLFGSIPTQQPAYAYLRSKYEGKLPNSDYLGLNAFYIGSHQYLTKDDLDYILKIFDEILDKK